MDIFKVKPDFIFSSYLISLILSFVLSYILSKVYIWKALSLSDHRSLARILPLISITTTIIISIVKSSFALSLGLVGALSIVRFRTPIKEPEELAFLFLSIAIGLATGADQYLAAVFGLIISILGIIFLNRQVFNLKNTNFLRLSVNNLKLNDLQKILNIASDNCEIVDLNNINVTSERIENNTSLILSIMPNSMKNLDNLMKLLKSEFPEVSFNIINKKNF